MNEQEKQFIIEALKSIRRSTQLVITDCDRIIAQLSQLGKKTYKDTGTHDLGGWCEEKS